MCSKHLKLPVKNNPLSCKIILQIKRKEAFSERNSRSLQTVNYLQRNTERYLTIETINRRNTKNKTKKDNDPQKFGIKQQQKLHIKVITLNVNENGLNSLKDTEDVCSWIRKQNPICYCLQEVHLNSKEQYRLKAKG